MRKYGLVTGSRSEYGLLRTLIKRINNSKNIDLKIIVTGSHLSKFHGETYKEIMKDGLNISKKIFLPIKKNNTKIDTTKFTGIAISKFADTFNNLKLDLVIILGDRYEIFAAAFSAMNLNIPVAHIHGGEKTLGSNDDRLNGLWSRSKDFFGDTFGSKGSQTNTTKTDPVNEANNEFEAAI